MAVWAVWLAAASGLYFFENNTGTRVILAAALMAPALSAIMARISAGRVGIALECPSECMAGDSLTCTVKVSGLLPGAMLCGRLEAENTLTGEKTWAELSAGGRYSIKVRHCGAVRVRLCGGRVCDMLGLRWSKEAEVKEAYIISRPRLYPPEIVISDLTAPSAEGERWSDTRPGSDPSETFAIREYHSGDPVRQIHWKLSQKNDNLMLRELGLPVSDDILLLFDRASGPSPDAVSGAAAAFLSISAALADIGRGHTAGWQNGGKTELEYVEREDDIAVLCGRVLSAKVSGDASPICRAAAAEGLGAGAAHIVICSPVFPDGTRELPSGGRITVISCGQAEGEEVVSADAEGRIINGYIEI